MTPPLPRFDGGALYAALDSQRGERGLSWPGVARALWEQSAELGAARPTDHPFSPATLTSLGRRGQTSCQHALFMLRWLDRMPEEFLVGESLAAGRPLPRCGPDRRPRWHLHARERRPRPGLYEALDGARRERELTWSALAGRLSASPSQLTGLRTARYATNMRLAMAITQWLRRPAADFIYPAGW